MTDQAVSTRPSSALLGGIPAAVGVVVSFVAAIAQYAGIDGGTTKSLTGLDTFLGAPNVAVGVILFSLFVTWSVGAAAGASYRHGLYVAAIVVASILTAYELLALVLNFQWYSIILLVAAAATVLYTVLDCRTSRAAGPQVARSDRPRIFGGWLVIAGVGGLIASYNLSVDKVTAVLHPTVTLNCSVNATVQCGKNLESWQGSLFGFPNPLIGLGGFAVVLAIGVLVLAGAAFARWWWIAFGAGVIGALAFIIFLIIESIYVIGTLCLWCSLVYFVLFPLFWLVVIRNVSLGTFRVGPRATRIATAVYSWVPLITLVCYIVVFLMFQTRLDVLRGL